MEAVLRAVFVYAFLLLLFRISGQRSLGQVTTFDFVLLLIIAEITERLLLGDNQSLTFGLIALVTLFAIDIGLSLVKQRSPRVDRALEGLPLVIVEDGRLLEDRMHKVRVDREDILGAARERQGVASIDEIRYAVLERNGAITVIPKRDR